MRPLDLIKPMTLPSNSFLKGEKISFELEFISYEKKNGKIITTHLDSPPPPPLSLSICFEGGKDHHLFFSPLPSVLLRKK